MDFLSFPANNKSVIKKRVTIFLYAALFLSLIYPFFQPTKAGATVTESFVRFNRLGQGAGISGTACIKTGTSGTEANVVIVFPIGFTISQTASNWTASAAAGIKDPGAAGESIAWPTIGSPATTVVGQSVVFSSGDLSSSTALYCFDFVGASSTIGAAANDQTGTLKTRTSANVLIDTVNWAVSTVAANADQVTVTASVAATMTFSLSGNSISLGTLTTSATSNGTVTLTLGTNAFNGVVAWIRGTNSGGGTGGGLYSPTANAFITSPASYPTVTDVTVTPGFVVDVDSGTNSPTIDSGYDGTDANSGGHIDGGYFRQILTKTGVQSGTTAVINARARIASTQAAASDYTDTLTVVASGSF